MRGQDPRWGHLEDKVGDRILGLPRSDVTCLLRRVTTTAGDSREHAPIASRKVTS
jgi:hypothetical protein